LERKAPSLPGDVGVGAGVDEDQGIAAGVGVGAGAAAAGAGDGTSVGAGAGDPERKAFNLFMPLLVLRPNNEYDLQPNKVSKFADCYKNGPPKRRGEGGSVGN
jgi:hypothetical protein